EDIDHSRTKTKSPQTTDVIDKDLFEGFGGFRSPPFLCSAEASRFSVPACPIGASRAGVVNRDRGTSRDATPPTPPGIRVRTTAVRRIKHPPVSPLEAVRDDGNGLW